eukprot:5906411-Pleurochrysis_carterae.AAC.2
MPLNHLRCRRRGLTLTSASPRLGDASTASFWPGCAAPRERELHIDDVTDPKMLTAPRDVLDVSTTKVCANR